MLFSILNMGVLGLRQPLPWYKFFIDNLSTIPSGISSNYFLTKYPVFLLSAFVLNVSKSTSRLV